MGKYMKAIIHKNEIKEIIEYANSLHIQIIPEIEMLAILVQLLLHIQNLEQPKKQIKVPCRFGVQYEVLDVSSKKSY